MAEYMNDDDQVEALKKWWKENGKSIIGGVVLGRALVRGRNGLDEAELGGDALGDVDDAALDVVAFRLTVNLGLMQMLRKGRFVRIADLGRKNIGPTGVGTLQTQSPAPKDVRYLR